MASTCGWTQRWTIPLPAGLSLRESMILGTAGFTAALALLRMQDNRQTPALGPIAVTGATGGVGMLAVDMYTRAGYEVHAISGKADHFDFLREPRRQPNASIATSSPSAASRWIRRASAARWTTSAAPCWPACCR